MRATRRELLGAYGALASCGFEDASSRWRREIVWLGGANGAKGISEWGNPRELPLSDDLRKHEIFLSDICPGGRYLTFVSNGLAIQMRMRPSAGCIDPVSGHISWLSTRFSRAGWSPGSNAIYETGFNQETRDPVIHKSYAGCNATPEATLTLSREERRWWRVSVGNGVALFGNGGRIWEWNDSGVREVADGVDASFAPDGRQISVLDANLQLRVMDWPSGRITTTFEGKFGDAGEWSPEGRRILVSDVLGGIGMPVPWERIMMYSFEKHRFQGGFNHRRMLGAHSLRWTAWPEGALRHVTVPWLARAIRGLAAVSSGRMC